MGSVWKTSFAIWLSLNQFCFTSSSANFDSNYGNTEAGGIHSSNYYKNERSISDGLYGRRDKREISLQNELFQLRKEVKKTHVKISHIEEKLMGVVNTIEQLSTSNRISDGQSECRLWPDGRIPFEVDSSLNSYYTRKYIEDAINDFHRKTCIRWVPRQSERAFVHFLKFNSTYVKTQECYTGGRRVAIVREEFTPKDILRQMAYILGFGDEHLRNDRDEYVQSRHSNCTLEKKYPHLNGGDFYDTNSIMHPSCDDETCLRAKNLLPCGISKSLSVLDAEKLNEMYRCGGCHTLRFQFRNQIGFNGNGLVPVFDDAHENRKHICRVYKQGNVLVGRGNLWTGECHYMYFGPQMANEGVQFLTNPRKAKIQWVTRDINFPLNAVPGGTDSSANPCYVARCPEEPQWGESVVPGWIYSSSDPSIRMVKKDKTSVKCASYDVLTCFSNNNN